MAFRGRGRGRGFGRGKPFPASDPIILSTEKPSVQHFSPYPTLEYFPAGLSRHQNYENMLSIKNHLITHFQLSGCHLKVADETKLFLIQSGTSCTKKATLNFDWDFFPLELRPTSKRKLKSNEEILASLRKNKMISLDMALFEKLEEKEQVEFMNSTSTEEEFQTKKEREESRDENDDDNEGEEFDDEELDLDNDYNEDYFDNGDRYLEEDNDLDEGPYF